MADEEQARDRSKRRDPARNARRDLPVIEGEAWDITPAVDPTPPAQATPDLPVVEPEAHSAEATPILSDSDRSAAVEEPAVTGAAPEAVAPETSSLPPHADAPLTQDASAPVPPQRTTRSYWGVIAALCIAVLAAGLLYALSQLSSLPPDNSAAVSDLRSRLAAVESRPSGDASGLSERVTQLEHDVGDVRNGVEAVGKRVDSVAASISAQPDVAGEIADLRKAIATEKSDLAAVTASVAALPRPDIGAIDTRLGDVNQRLASLQGVVSSIPHVDLGPLTGKVDALEARLKPVEAEASAAQSPGQVAQRRAAPVAVTAQAISDAIATGQAFPDELKALQALGVDAAKLAPLQAVAGSGAPSLRDLQASLSELRDRIVTRGATPASGSYMDRLVSGASSLVQVRPLGSVVGDSPSAIASRINDDLGNDDLTAALAEWHKLPEASQTASKALADRITLRLDAERAARGIAADAIAAMATPRG